MSYGIRHAHKFKAELLTTLFKHSLKDPDFTTGAIQSGCEAFRVIDTLVSELVGTIAVWDIPSNLLRSEKATSGFLQVVEQAPASRSDVIEGGKVYLEDLDGSDSQPGVPTIETQELINKNVQEVVKRVEAIAGKIVTAPVVTPAVAPEPVKSYIESEVQDVFADYSAVSAAIAMVFPDIKHQAQIHASIYAHMGLSTGKGAVYTHAFHSQGGIDPLNLTIMRVDKNDFNALKDNKFVLAKRFGIENSINHLLLAVEDKSELEGVSRLLLGFPIVDGWHTMQFNGLRLVNIAEIGHVEPGILPDPEPMTKKEPKDLSSMDYLKLLVSATIPADLNVDEMKLYIDDEKVHVCNGNIAEAICVDYALEEQFNGYVRTYSLVKDEHVNPAKRLKLLSTRDKTREMGIVNSPLQILREFLRGSDVTKLVESTAPVQLQAAFCAWLEVSAPKAKKNKSRSELFMEFCINPMMPMAK